MEYSKSLIEIAQKSAQLEQMLIESEGQLTPELEAELAVKELDMPDKFDSYSYVIDRMDSLSAFYKDKAQFFLKLSKAADSVTDRCKSNLKFAMETMGVLELSGNDVKFKLVKSNPSVVINNEDLVDKAYKIEKITYQIDKKGIAEELKLGLPVAGCSLEQNYSLRTYANSPSPKSKKAVKSE